MSEDVVRLPRPASVTIAAWILILPALVIGLFVIVSTILMVVGFMGGFMGGFGGEAMGSRMGGMILLFMLISIVVSMILPVGLVLLGMGLLRMRPWASPVTVTVCALLLVLAFGPLAFGNRVEPLQLLAGAAVPVVVATLLLLPPSREAFAGAREQQNI